MPPPLCRGMEDLGQLEVDGLLRLEPMGLDGEP